MIAWRSSVFSADHGSIQRVSDGMNEAKCVALAIDLKHEPSGVELHAIGSHFKSDKDRAGEAFRVTQGKRMFGGDAPLIQLSDDKFVVFGCDLNANPVMNRHGYAPRCYEWLTSSAPSDVGDVDTVKDASDEGV